jgi:hypothetical protein
MRRLVTCELLVDCSTVKGGVRLVTCELLADCSTVKGGVRLVTCELLADCSTVKGGVRLRQTSHHGESRSIPRPVRRPVRVGLVVDKVELALGFLRVLRFPLVTTITPLLHTHSFIYDQCYIT